MYMSHSLYVYVYVVTLGINLSRLLQISSYQPKTRDGFEQG